MKALERWMQSTGTTQTELARLCEVSQPTISDILSGKHEPSLRLLRKLAKVTGLTLDQLASNMAA